MKLAGAGALAVAALGMPARGAPAAEAAPGQPRPNFVVILIDDMGYGDIGPFGSKINRTPNLDRLAAEGMKLTSFYAAPVCTPSRAQLLTGSYAKRVSLPDVLFPADTSGLSDREHTVAELLRRRGYATMAIGKWHLGDQPEFLPIRHGFDHYLGVPYSNDMGTESGSTYPPLPLLRDLSVIEAPVDQDTLTARYTEEAVKFIRSNQDRPFFLYLAHTAVHVPLHPGRNFAGKSANGSYGDWIEEVDWSAGRVVDTLKELKLDRNTLVLFTSDNGPWLRQGTNAGVAGPLRGGKGETWEGGMREPTIVWWPGRIAAGSARDAPLSEIDVLPTLVGLAGGTVPADNKIDGKDIWPLLSGRTNDSPHEALFYFNGSRLEAVRAGAWKLRIENKQLYNLDHDIGETTNVAKHNPEVVARLMTLVEQMGADLGLRANGPGVRKPARVKRPKPLLLRPARTESE
jgi:arylsulfatase A-like enzyme